MNNVRHSIRRNGFSVSVLALCGAVLWGLVETLALLRSRWAQRHTRSA